MKKIIKQSTFLCFSPPVMIATFFIEIALVMWTLLVRPRNQAVRIGTLLITFLAIFQLAEYSICESLGFSSNVWAKLGFASITMLPPLGIHLVHVISNKKNKPLVIGSYAVAAIWIGVFIASNIMKDTVCSGNYVIFRISEPYELWYYIYYDALLVLAVIQSLYFAYKTKKKLVKRALNSLAIGYLCFIVPSVSIRLFFNFNHAGSALPSIMCGFAVLLAIAITFKVLPNTSTKRKK